jgi:hypothetical protein
VEQYLEPWYVTGFCEACGTFTYSRSGHVIGLYFALKVGASDLALLQAIQRFFGGAGRLYDTRPASETVGWRHASFYYRVTRATDLERLLSHFDNYPLAGRKARVYGIWREMVVLKTQFRRPDRARLAQLADLLSASRSESASDDRVS